MKGSEGKMRWADRKRREMKGSHEGSGVKGKMVEMTGGRGIC